MEQQEILVLRRIGLEGLSKHCGQLILNAIKSVYNTDLDKELAKILLLRNQKETFNDREVRLDILDTLSEVEVSELCHKSKIFYNDYVDGLQKLQKYYDKRYDVKKSAVFVDFFGLNKEYCKTETIDRRNSCEKVDLEYGEPIKLKSYLHPYQKRIKDTILQRLSQPGDRVMAQMPTGSGKTFTSLEAVVDLLRSPFQKKYAVWIVNTNELTEQALDSFKYVWKLKGDRPLNIYRLFKDFEPELVDEGGGMIFTSFPKFHAILSNTSHPYHSRLWEIISNTEILIIDEAHRSVADTYGQCIEAFMNGGGAKILGLTATPGRNCFEESHKLSEMFFSNLVNITDDKNIPIPDVVKYLQNQNYLAEIEDKELETNIDIAWATDEKKILATLAGNASRNKKILDQIILANDSNESTIVFACTKDHVLALHILCQGQGIESRFITGDISQVERINILDDFRCEKYYILINQEMLSTGIDLPNTNKLIISRPITSIILYSQILGRALRGPLNGGNSKNTIINIADNIRNYPSESFIYKSFSEFW